MTIALKQSTAYIDRLGPFLDDDDGKTVEPSLTITQGDIQISKGGGAFAQTSASSPTTTYDADGWYQVPLTATDTATLGPLKVQIDMSGALPVWADYSVVPSNVYEALYGSDKLEVDLVSVYGTALTSNVVKSDLTTILTQAHPAERLKASTDLMLAFTVQATPTPTTTSCGTDLDSGSYTVDLTDILEGRTILFATGDQIYGAARITGYNGTNGDITFTALPAAPASTDTAIIV